MNTSAMPASFFEQNRRNFYAKLQPGSFVVIPANTQMQRNNDTAHPFEQEPNFWYLTGIDDPDWLLLADIDSGREWLVAPHIAEIIRTFDGGISNQDAVRRSGIAEVLDAPAGRAELKNLLAVRPRAYALAPLRRKVHGVFSNPVQQDVWRKLSGVAREDARLPLAKLRAIKQPSELQAMQAAIDITIDSIGAMLSDAKTYRYEYQAAAKLDYEFKTRGAQVGFDTIVAAGKNACTIHHMPDASPIAADDWLLFDVGAQVNHYSADISRSIPLGEPTPRQLEIYEALVQAHDHVAALLRPGQNVREFLQEVETIMTHQLANLGLIKPGDTKASHKYFPHAIGHGLGLDVHDALGRPEIFAENMVMTVEPGIYIPEEGIGMRIESVAHVTADSPVLMSRRLPIELGALRTLLK